MRTMLVALAAALVGAGAAAAQTPSPSPSGIGIDVKCAATPAKLPAEYAGWASPVSVVSAKAKAGLDKARLTLGKGAKLALTATPDVVYPTPPEKPGEPTSKGGLASFKVEAAGVYFVALGVGAWIDVIDQDGKAQTSAAHGHGPDCSGIRKIVDFKLTQGVYALQISGSNTADVGVLIGKR